MSASIHVHTEGLTLPFSDFVHVVDDALQRISTGLDVMPNVGLPTYSQKGRRFQGSWTRKVYLPIPGIPGRRLRIYVPDSARLQQFGASRLSRRRGFLLICVACAAMVVTVMSLKKTFGRTDPWVEPYRPQSDPPTLVFQRDDLKRIWSWEIASGHYPSRQSSTWPLGSIFVLWLRLLQYRSK